MGELSETNEGKKELKGCFSDRVWKRLFRSKAQLGNEQGCFVSLHPPTVPPTSRRLPKASTTKKTPTHHWIGLRKNAKGNHGFHAQNDGFLPVDVPLNQSWDTAQPQHLSPSWSACSKSRAGQLQLQRNAKPDLGSARECGEFNSKTSLETQKRESILESVELGSMRVRAKRSFLKTTWGLTHGRFRCGVQLPNDSILTLTGG